MFNKTYRIEILTSENEIDVETFIGNYFQMSARVTELRNQGCSIQSVNKI